METFTMNRKELPRAGLVKAALSGRITNRRGATALHLTIRQFQRLKRRFESGGAPALRHRSRGQPSPRRLPPELRGGYASSEKSRPTSTATGRSTVQRTCLFSRQSACKDGVFPPSKFSSAPHSPQGDGGVRCHHADGFHRRLRPAHLATGKPVYWMIDL